MSFVSLSSPGQVGKVQTRYVYKQQLSPIFFIGLPILDMFLLLLGSILLGLLTYLALRPLIDSLFYSVPHEPRYIPSYVPVFGFGLKMVKNPIEFIRSLVSQYGKTFVIRLSSKRWVYLFDEQTFLTKVLKSSDLSIDEFLADILVHSLDVSRQCASNEDIQHLQLKQFHQYLVGEELELLNKRVHDSLLTSLKLDAQRLHGKGMARVNLFDFFGELMFFAGTEGLFGPAFVLKQRKTQPDFYQLFRDFDQAYKYGVFRVPLRKFLYRTIFERRDEFIQRFFSLKSNDGESSLIRAREELFRSDQYKHLFSERDAAAFQASMLWAAVANTGPISSWVIIDLLLHPRAMKAVKEELNEQIGDLERIYERDGLSKLKILESCINETMRRILNTVSTRQAMTNTTVECLDKTKIGLRKGDMLIYPAFVKHFDPTLFGPDPYEYQYDRFVKKAHQSKAPSLMIFGCGHRMCPGRYWAVHEIKILVAFVIRHMNLDLINISEADRDAYRKKLPHDYSKFISSGGPKKGHEKNFDIEYSYKFWSFPLVFLLSE